MLSIHGTHLKLTLDKKNVNLDSPSFVRLYCFGLFDIYGSQYTFTLGRIMLTVTIQLSMDSHASKTSPDAHKPEMLAIQR